MGRPGLAVAAMLAAFDPRFVEKVIAEPGGWLPWLDGRAMAVVAGLAALLLVAAAGREVVDAPGARAR